MAATTRAYPGIGGNSAEVSGVLDLAGVASTLFSYGAATFSSFSALTGMANPGFIKVQLNGGTVRVIPMLENS